MFFARARVPGLSIDFSQTPLGLLVSEDDGPERRLRPGFELFDSIKDALVLLIDLQPGFEDILLWSAVRHDHLDIVKYLIDDLEWNVETRSKGLTMLHSAILYGRKEIARYLLERDADPLATTDRRHLNCLHLLVLNPRDTDTDIYIYNLLSGKGIDPNAKEQVDGLTALHIAVRNQKTEMIRRLLQDGADLFIPVIDKLPLLSQGRNGYLSEKTDRPLVFTKYLTIIGEVVIQHIQENFYPQSYVADLLVIYLNWVNSHCNKASKEDLLVDAGNGISIIHLLALTDPPDGPPRPWKSDWFRSLGSDQPVRYPCMILI